MADNTFDDSHVLTADQLKAKHLAIMQQQVFGPRTIQPNSPFNSNSNSTGHQQHTPSPMNRPNNNGMPSHPDLQLPTSPQSSRSPQSILSPGPKSPTEQPLSYMESMLLLTKGEDFIKYRANQSMLSVFGRSKENRYVYYEKEAGSMGKLYWCKPGMRTKDETRCIPLSQVTGLYEQAETEAFSKSLTPDERLRCFSIVCGPRKNEKGETVKGRTLDLQAKTVAIRDTWLHCIHQIMVHAGFNVHEKEVKSPPPVLDVKSPTSASVEAINTAANLNKQAQLTAKASNNQREASMSGFSTPIPIASPFQSPASQTPAALSPNGIRQSPTAHVNPTVSTMSPTAAAEFAALPIGLMSSMAGGRSPLNSDSSDHPDDEAVVPLSSPILSPKIHMDSEHVEEVEKIVDHNEAMPNKEPDALVYDDPLIQAKLIQSLSPTSNAELPLPHDASREIPATLTVPHATESNMNHLLSPSEHPTQTPMCSPIGV